MQQWAKNAARVARAIRESSGETPSDRDRRVRQIKEFDVSQIVAAVAST
jgi:hypothetical protein